MILCMTTRHQQIREQKTCTFEIRADHPRQYRPRWYRRISYRPRCPVFYTRDPYLCKRMNAFHSPPFSPRVLAIASFDEDVGGHSENNSVSIHCEIIRIYYTHIMTFSALRVQCNTAGRAGALHRRPSRHVVFQSPVGRTWLRQREERMAGDSKDTMTVKAGDPDRYVCCRDR